MLLANFPWHDPMAMNHTEVVEHLKQATEGLLFTSESEYPFDVFVWEAPGLTPLTEAKLLRQTEHAENTPVKCSEVDDLFDFMTQPQIWHNPEEQETAKKYQQLVETIKADLSEVKVYRLGDVEIDIYIIGKTPDGNLAGITTKAVES